MSIGVKSRGKDTSLENLFRYPLKAYTISSLKATNWAAYTGECNGYLVIDTMGETTTSNLDAPCYRTFRRYFATPVLLWLNRNQLLPGFWSLPGFWGRKYFGVLMWNMWAAIQLWPSLYGPNLKANVSKCQLNFNKTWTEHVRIYQHLKVWTKRFMQKSKSLNKSFSLERIDNAEK